MRTKGGLPAIRRRFPGITDEQLAQALDIYDAVLSAHDSD